MWRHSKKIKYYRIYAKLITNKVGEFNIKDSITLRMENKTDLENIEKNIITIEKIFSKYPKVNIEQSKIKYFLNGVKITQNLGLSYFWIQYIKTPHIKIYEVFYIIISLFNNFSFIVPVPINLLFVYKMAKNNKIRRKQNLYPIRKLRKTK